MSNEVPRNTQLIVILTKLAKAGTYSVEEIKRKMKRIERFSDKRLLRLFNKYF